MARLLTAGAEAQVLSTTASQDGEGESLVSTGTVTFNTANPRSGGACYSCGAANNFVGRASLVTSLSTDYFFRSAIRFDAAPNGNLNILEYRAAGLLLALRLKTDSTLRLVDSTSTEVGTASAALSTNTWYVAEVKINIPAAGNGTAAFRVNGQVVQNDLSTSVGNAAFTTLRAGHVGTADTATTMLVDDIALNDTAAGGAQTSWPGCGKVVLLLPTADSAVGTGWQEPDNTTDNLHGCVDTVPPAGVASPGSGTSQIKNADATAGSLAYDATVTDYITAGVGGGEIVLTQGLFRLSGSSATGTNNALARVVSNPADGGDTTFTAAFDKVAGTDPSVWQSWKTAANYAPAVTKPTAPVIRIIKNAATTRVHMCDLMGLLVEYEEAKAEIIMAPLRGAV